MVATKRNTESWEPMETAPLDGTPIWVRRSDLEDTVSWSADFGAWAIGVAKGPNLPRILPWQPTEWVPIAGALE